MKIQYLFGIGSLCVLLTMLSFPLSAEPTQDSSRTRIIGGGDADEWPWMVLIKYEHHNDVFCGGSLIYPDWILTAAHCVDGFSSNAPPLTPNEMSVIVGLHNRTRIDEEGEQLEISRVIQHPQWKSSNKSSPFDIALLQLKTPSTQPPIVLPLNSATEVGEETIAIGWGNLTTETNSPVADILQEVELPLVSNETCQTAYINDYEIIDSMLCAGYAEGGKDTCFNDSGGPLMVFKDNQWLQVGITSYGGKHNGPRCAGPDAYGVYTRVSAFIDFITQFVPLSMTSEPSITGIYNGIWTSPALPNGFFMLRNTAETIVVVILTPNGKSWQALLGSTAKLGSTVTTFIASAEITAKLEPVITSSSPLTEATFTVIACQPQKTSPEDACLLPVGSGIQLNKIF